MAGTSAPTFVAGAAPLWLEAKLMLARWCSGRSSRVVWLRKSLGDGSCELVRASTGDDLAESERAGVCCGRLGRPPSKLFANGVEMSHTAYNLPRDLAPITLTP